MFIKIRYKVFITRAEIYIEMNKAEKRVRAWVTIARPSPPPPPARIRYIIVVDKDFLNRSNGVRF